MSRPSLMTHAPAHFCVFLGGKARALTSTCTPFIYFSISIGFALLNRSFFLSFFLSIGFALLDRCSFYALLDFGTCLFHRVARKCPCLRFFMYIYICAYVRFSLTPCCPCCAFLCIYMCVCICSSLSHTMSAVISSLLLFFFSPPLGTGE